MTISGRFLSSPGVFDVTLKGSVISNIQLSRDISGETSGLILPGFLDIQVNGIAGMDYSGEHLAPGDIAAVTRALAEEGTTRHVPTLITNSFERIRDNLKIIAKAREEEEFLRQAVPGIHLEGPYISSEEGPRGAHDPRYIRDPHSEEFAAWQEASGNAVRMITLAPERKGALSCIEQWSGQGVIVALGHTAAEPGLIREAVAAGARLSTHLGNGSHSLLPRLENYLWEQLAQDGLYADLICDGFHLPAAVLKTFLRAKPLDRLIAVSDVTALAGSPPGAYHWGNMRVEVAPSGRIGLAGTPFLAGAGHVLSRGIRTLMAQGGLELKQAVEMCTVNPAALLGLPEVSLEPRTGDFVNLSLCGLTLEGELRFDSVCLGDRVLFKR